jgi:RND family efflux transporter MFP subunit
MQNIKTKISAFFQKVSSSKFFQAVKNFIKVHKVWSLIIAVLIIFLGYFGFSKLFASESTIQYTFGRVSRGSLVVSVSGSGQVSTLSKVSIKPNTTGQTQTLGQIISVKVQNGDTVKAGQVVAILDGKNALQTLNQAKASVTSAQASYNKLTNGLTDSQSLSLNNSITSAQTSVDNAKQNILIQLKGAYTSASNAVYLNTDSFFADPTNSNPEISVSGVSFNNQVLEYSINQERIKVGEILNNWRDIIKTQTASDDLVTTINNAISNLNTIRNYFDDMTTLFALNSLSSDQNGQSTLNSAKNTAASARSSMDSSISSLTSTLQSYNNSLFQLQEAKSNLAVQQEPPSKDDSAVSKANLDNAEANLANAEVAYASRIITAPFDGQIGGLTASIGQQVSSSDSLGTLITSEKVIGVTLNEIDAAKVSAGNPVTITFDSLPNVSITGKVSYIDPLGTVSQGVVSYSVQISMDEQNDQIKTGMTATVAIVTTQHTNTLIIPASAITTTGGKKYVLVADISSSTEQTQLGNFNRAISTRKNFATSTFASTSRQFGSSSKISSSITTQYPVIRVEITTGISNDTSTEVLSGLTEGQLIVTKKSTVTSSSAKKTSASTATTNSRGGFGIGGFGGGTVSGSMMMREN